MKQRRQFTAEFKARVVLDLLTGVQTPAEARREHGLSPNLPAQRKAAFLERVPLALLADEERDGQAAKHRVGAGPGPTDARKHGYAERLMATINEVAMDQFDS